MRRAKWAWAAFAVIAATSAWPAKVWAAESPMPPDIAKTLAELGRVIDPPATAKLYAPLQQTEPYFGVRIERDLKYGPAERNRLDIFMPQATASGRPVLIFVHGGAFIGGNKRRTPDSPFYDNIMLWAVKNGFIGVNITYRLAPQFPWPAGAEDVGIRRQMGFRRDRRARRRPLAHLPDGPLGRRDPRRKLCVASGILQGEERRPERRDHGVRDL